MAAPSPAELEPRPFGIYVHWPFCRSKCPYCDFNSHVRDRIDEDAWRQGLVTALERSAAQLAKEGGERRVGSIFFGGGTPSLMPPATAAAVIEAVHRLWPVTDDLEITLEANPTSVEAERFAGFRAAGVNRLSMGIQSLRAEDLAFLGRQHSVGEARAAIQLAARHFPRFSFDLIYARPAQTVAAWQAELREALDLAVGHLSVYQLTIEEGTAFHTAYRRGDFVLPGEDLAADLYLATQATLTEAGLPAYEVSNHARPGQESRHNLLYWRYGDYVGVGPGAHGRLTLGHAHGRLTLGHAHGRLTVPPAETGCLPIKWATRQHKAPETWLAAIARGEDGMAEASPVQPGESLDEMLMMGLRLTEGIPDARFRRDFGQSFRSLLDPAKLSALIEEGLLAEAPDRLTLTEAGRLRLNAVLRYLT